MKRALVAMAVIVLSVCAGAQTSTTSLRGTVADPKGAVVQGAEVTIVNPATNYTRSSKTDEDGVYQFVQLPPGTYTVAVTAAGFAKIEHKDVRLLVATPTTLNFELKVAAAGTVLEVKGETPLVNTTDATLGNAFGPDQVAALPFEGRDPVGILSLQPGVAYVGNKVDQEIDSRGGAVNGARSDQTNVTLDGVDNNDQLKGLAFTGALRATLDSLQEFRVITGNANADAGRSSGAQVSLVTKSGTNNFHGSVYEFHRPTFGTGNDWFNKQSQVENGLPNRPGKLIRNTFGASFGGPVVKDRFFFFGTYEGQRTRETEQVTFIVPSDDLRNGFISYPALGGGIVRLTPADIASMDPFGPGVNPNSLALLQTYPQPNTDSVGDGLNYRGFTWAAPTPEDLNTYIAKLDFVMDSRGDHRLFARGTLQDDKKAGAPRQDLSGWFPGQPAPRTVLTNSKGVAAGYTAALTPRLVNNLRYGFIRQSFSESGVGMANAVFFRGLTLPGSREPSRTVIVPVHNLSDDVTWTKGRHTFQFGANYRRTRAARASNESSFFSASSNPSWLDNAAIANTGSSLDPAAFGFQAVDPDSANVYDLPIAALVGIVPQVNSNYNRDKTGAVLALGEPAPRKYGNYEFEFYGQHVWRATPSLTLTFGLRWTFLEPPFEVTGTQVQPTIDVNEWFHRRAEAMQQGLSFKELLTFDLSGKANNGKPFWPWDKRNIAPRVAFAWSPGFERGFLSKLFGGSGRSSIRGGYGMYYDHFGQGIVNTFDRQGAFGLTTGLTNAAGGQSVDGAPRFTGLNDVPSALVIPPPAGGFPLTFPGDVNDPGGTLDSGGFAITWGLDDKLRTPYSHVFNLSYTRELPGHLVFEAAYVGRLGRRLLQQDDLAMPLNLVDPTSGQDYFTAATLLSQAAEQGVNMADLAPIPFWENRLASAAGVFDPTGCAPDVATFAGVPTATQAAYNLMSCFLHNETTGLFVIDLFCDPGCFTTADGVTEAFQIFHPQFSSLYAWRSIGVSSYHAGQFSLRRRTGSLQFDLNYTWSKSRDMGSDAERISLFEGFGLGGQVINAWNPRQLLAVSDFDTTHQVNANVVWELPFGKEKRWGSGWSGAADAVLGGWQIANLFRWTTGYPFGLGPGLGNWPTNWELTGAVFNTQSVQTGRFIDADGDPNMFNGVTNPLQFFRFAHPGESGQRNNFRGDGYFSIDLGLSKSWTMPWSESHKVKFGWEIFNVTNTPRFDVAEGVAFNGSITDSTNLGKYTKTLTRPRIMQFALRYSF